MGFSNRVVFDTNMLLAVLQFKVDVFGMVEERLGKTQFFVTESVLEELEKIAGQGPKKQKEVALVKEILENNAVQTVPGNGNADKDLAELALQGFLVATNDKKLRKRIKMLGGKNIYLKAKKLIEFE